MQGLKERGARRLCVGQEKGPGGVLQSNTAAQGMRKKGKERFMPSGQRKKRKRREDWGKAPKDPQFKLKRKVWNDAHETQQNRKLCGQGVKSSWRKKKNWGEKQVKTSGQTCR